MIQRVGLTIERCDMSSLTSVISAKQDSKHKHKNTTQ